MRSCTLIYSLIYTINANRDPERPENKAPLLTVKMDEESASGH